MILLVLMLFLLCSCGPPQEDYQVSLEWYEERIYNWMNKESECLHSPEYIFDPDFLINEQIIIEAFDETRNELEIVIDPAIEWMSSCEIAQILKGDCDTFSIWLWKKLRDQWFPDNINGMMIVYLIDFDSFHLVNAFKYKNDFYIVDTMRIITPIFSPLSEIEEPLEPIIWFNLFESQEL